MDFFRTCPENVMIREAKRQKPFINGLPAFHSNAAAMLHNQGFRQHNHCNRG